MSCILEELFFYLAAVFMYLLDNSFIKRSDIKDEQNCLISVEYGLISVEYVSIGTPNRTITIPSKE